MISIISSLVDKICNLFLEHKKYKPVFKIDGWTTNPISNDVVVSIDNTKGDFFVIADIETEDNLICTERLPKNANVGDIVSLTFYYKGENEIPSKDTFCITMHYKNKMKCKYKCKLIYCNDNFWIEF